MIGWQPKETAPKDGTPFLAYIEKLQEYPGKGRVRVMAWRNGWSFETIPSNFAYAVTHWMPLPEPPTEVAK